MEETKYQEARKKITEVTYNNMERHKGIGVNEVSTAFSFLAPYGKDLNTWGWFQTAKETTIGIQNYAITWDNDKVLIGNSAYLFIMRGGRLY